MDFVENLMKLGFTRHESVLYLTLCKEGELTGYEASKLSGISRSNAYLALAGLVEKGGAYRIEGDAARFIAVPVPELVQNIRGDFQKVFDYLVENVPEVRGSSEPFITISGKKHIIDKMKNIIGQALERVYLSTSENIIGNLVNEITEARDKGLKVVVITSSSFSMDGIKLYHNERQDGQIRLIADTSYVLTGEISDKGESSCIYSRNKNLVSLIKDSLTNEIRLIEMKL